MTIAVGGSMTKPYTSTPAGRDRKSLVPILISYPVMCCSVFGWPGNWPSCEHKVSSFKPGPDPGFSLLIVSIGAIKKYSGKT